MFRTLYDANDELIGVMDTPEDALAVVYAVNSLDAREREIKTMFDQLDKMKADRDHWERTSEAWRVQWERAAIRERK